MQDIFRTSLKGKQKKKSKTRRWKLTSKGLTFQTATGLLNDSSARERGSRNNRLGFLVLFNFFFQDGLFYGRNSGRNPFSFPKSLSVVSCRGRSEVTQKTIKNILLLTGLEPTTIKILVVSDFKISRRFNEISV